MSHARGTVLHTAGARWWARAALTALLGALLLLPAASAPAQELSVRTLPGNTEAAPPPEPASVRNPSALRTVLLSFHGFTRAELEAASTEVPAQLRALATDAGQPMVLRRSAAKALKLYPSDETFAFLAERLPSAPAGLDIVYALQLEQYAAARPEAVRALLTPLLRSGQSSLQNAAIRAARALPDGGRSLLAPRLTEALEPGVRKALEAALRDAP